ncbi:MAG: TonB-dependent receptor plug domain-containing protein [Flavobacteriaceae bacterium]|nr:TonB-dependent receptor plug domain-containing protein [Flavobacteriaceae bacterium]
MRHFCWLFILFCITAKAQQNQLVSLHNYISLTENEFDVFFSFADDEVAPLQIPNRNFSALDQQLKHIQNYSYFEISQVSDQIYTLVAKDDLIETSIEVRDFFTDQPISSYTIGIKNLIFKSDTSPTIQLKYPASFENLNMIIDAENHQVLRQNLSSLQQQKNNVIYLDLRAEDLESILISNYIASGINKLKNGNKRIEVNKFKSFPGLVEPDILQNIQILPGVNSVEESLSYLNIRGGTHDQNLFLWDGIKMYQTAHFFGMISAFSPYMIESTEVSKNATNARYFDGVSGMIKMQTSQQIASESRTEIGFNLINADVFTDQPINSTSSIQFSARHSLNFALNTPTYTSFFDKVFQNTEIQNNLDNNANEAQNFNFFDTSIRYLNQITEKDRIRLNFVFHQNNFDLSLHDSSASEASVLGSELNQSNWSGGLNWERKWNDLHVSTIQFGISEYSLDGLNASFINQQSLFQINKVQDWNFNWHHTQKWSKQLLFSYGVQFNETGVTNTEEYENPFFFREVKQSILVSGAYGGIEFQSKDEMSKLYLGGRLNHFSQFNTLNFEPRFYFRQKFLNHFTIEVSTEQKSQVTTQLVDLQTDFLGVENRRWVVASPNERPILKAQQVELELQYFKNNWLLSLAGYVKSVEGIGTQSQGFVNQFQFLNDFGEYNVVGLDFLVNKQMNQTSTWFSYSFMDNKYRFENLTPSEFPNNTNLAHIFNFGIQHKIGDFDFSTGASWHSGVPYTGLQNSGVGNSELAFASPNQFTLPNYFRLDASVNYHIQLSEKVKLKSGISFWNITDRKNVYKSFFEANQEADGVQNIQQLGLGFTPNFLVRLIF